MQIHLIADAVSFVLMDPLVRYLQPFMSKGVTFHIRPYEGQVKSYWSWENLFAVGHQEKTKSLLPPGEHYFIFLFYGANEHNWFGSVNPDEPNVGFLQSYGWDKFDFNDPVYPIAYHLMTLVTAMKFFGGNLDMDIFHGQSKGCMFDFTGVKEEVLYKLLSAHICPECLAKIGQQAEDRVEAIDYMQRLLRLFRSVKEQLFAIDLQQYFGHLEYSLMLKQDASLSLTVDGSSIPLKISSGWEKALFIMLLKHENGLSYKDFERDQVLKEYLWIYYRYFVNNGSFESLYKQSRQQIADNTFRKQLHTHVSRIRRKLEASLSAYPEVLNAISIKSSQGAYVVPLHRQHFINNLDKSHLNIG